MSKVALLVALALSSCSNGPGNEEPDSGAATDVLDVGSEETPEGACEDGPGEVFEERIRPLIENERPSSCAKCHASGVDLAAFVRADACASMECLISQGLVDLDAPAQSALLGFISRGYGGSEQSGVTDEMVREEYKGFLAWIQWAASCQDVACADAPSCGARPETPLLDMGTPDADVGLVEPPPLTLQNYPCGDAHQVQAFLDHAFPGESRCGHCHSTEGAIAGIAGAPVWMAAHRDFDGAVETIGNLYALGAINLAQPAKSRVLLKPLNPDYGGIDHGGGSKFLNTEDPLYQALLTWIELQRECRVSDSYPQTGNFDEDGKH